MIPGNEANTRLGYRTIALRGWAASAVVEGESALPLLLDWAFEDGDIVGLAEVWREEAIFVSSARLAVRNLRRIIRRPPDFIWTGWRRTAGRGAAGDRRGKAVWVIGCVGALPLGTVDVVIICPIHRVGDAGLFQVVEASSLLGFGFRAGERGQQHRSENGNDCDDDEQLDESKRIEGQTVVCGCTWTERRVGVLFHRA